MRKLITILTLIIAIYLTYQINEVKNTLQKLNDDYKRTEWVKAAKKANDTTKIIAYPDTINDTNNN